MGPAFTRKYNTLLVDSTAIYIPVIKRAVVDFAIGADWTPASGDVKISIDGAAVANVTNLPTAVTSGNAAFWKFVLTAAELTGKQMVVTVADSATKAVEDQCFLVETFGHASAMYVTDLSAALATPTNITAGTLTTVGSVTTGVTLASAAVQAIWDALTSALTTSGSIGKWILDKLDVVVSTRLATSGYSAAPTAAAVSDAVWDEALTDHSGVSGSTAAALNAAGAGGDPWSTAIPGAYAAGTAGKILGDRLDQQISTLFTTALSESYNVDGFSPTPAQAIFVIMQRLTEFTKAGTTITVKKLNGSTTAFTCTVDDADSPTSISRAT